MKKGTVIIWLGLVFAGIIALFWHNEWVYNLPTPVPVNYRNVATGKLVSLPSKVPVEKNKPVFLHFFNPQCPCSRFNIEHFKSLVKQYGNDVSFAMIVISDREYTTKEIQDRFDISVPVLFDTALATTCGVYSTPQAVILDTAHELYYRGNYNRSRYCSDKKTEYARIALQALLTEQPPIAFDNYALTAYGCKLSTCTKK